MILAGGYAKRLWPITLTQSKALLRVGNKPVIEYIMENLEKTNVTEVIISTNQKFEKDFNQWIERYSPKTQKMIRLFVESTDSEENKYGVLRGISYLIEKEEINEDCLIIAGDNLFDFEINDLLKFYHENRGFVVAVYNIDSKEKAKLYGVVNIDDKQRITQFIEKPSLPTSTLVSTCCYVIPKDIFYLISEYLKQENVNDAPGHFLQWVHKRIPVYAFSFEGHWFDIGDKEILKKAEEWVKTFGSL